MFEKIEKFLKKYKKINIPDIKSGDKVKIHHRIKETVKGKGKNVKEEVKERIQIFEGIIIAIKHGKEMGSMITVRSTVGNVGVEKIFPLHGPTVEKIEVTGRAKTRRAKLYYLRERTGKKARLKREEGFESFEYNSRYKEEERAEKKEEEGTEENPNKESANSREEKTKKGE